MKTQIFVFVSNNYADAADKQSDGSFRSFPVTFSCSVSRPSYDVTRRSLEARWAGGWRLEGAGVRQLVLSSVRGKLFGVDENTNSTSLIESN